MSDDVVDLLDRAYRRVWREHDLEGGLGAVRVGPEGAVAFFRDWLEPWEDVHVEWELHRVDDERAVRMVLFADVDKGFEAAGLER